MRGEKEIIMLNINEIIKEMTTEEKVYLLQAKNAWKLNGVDRLGVPEIVLTDGPHGVRFTPEGAVEAIPSTAVPAESILSSSWDTDLLYQLGEMLAQECHEIGVDILLGPGVNGKRSPLAGRNFEYFSEDPYLAGKLAAAIIRGIQDNGVGTSLKHFVCNDQETRRFSADSNMDERTFREIYLKSFEIAIKEGKPWTIMGSYNKFRGDHVCENEYLLKDILRDEFGYEGTVLTDWGACCHKVRSHQNGLDLETGSFERAQEMLDAIEDGSLSMDVMDLHVRRVLELIDKVMEGRREVTVDWNAHHEMVRKAEEESMVLLKNQDDLLPLKEGSSVAVIGRFAMHLPEGQLALVRRIAAVNENIVLVNASGAPVELYPIEPQAKAILHTGLGGQALGGAVANILFGRSNPCGKLSETFPIYMEQNPSYPYFPGCGDEVFYSEGLLVGYRYYDTRKVPALYPFGFGLSYTKFEYSDLKLSADRMGREEDTLHVSLKVTNTGAMAGKEIVELYVRDEKSYLMRPLKELKGFAKVFLEAGETKTVEMDLPRDAFACYSPRLNRFAVEEGLFTIMACASVEDIRLTASVYVESADEVKPPLGPEDTIGEMLEDERYHDHALQTLSVLQITEDHPIFTVLKSCQIKSVPQFLTYLQIPLETGEEIAAKLMEKSA